MKPVKVYVGCGLTFATPEFKDKIESFKAELRKRNWIEVLDFLGKIKPEADGNGNRPLEVYTHDIHNCVMRSKIIIADLSVNSTGLGYELATCIEHQGIRTLMCAQKGSIVSDLLLGIPFHEENLCATFHWYEHSIQELLPYFISEIKKLHY